MDLTQLFITVLAVLGILIMGAMAVVPTVLEFTAGSDRTSKPEPRSVSRRATRDDHELAA